MEHNPDKDYTAGINDHLLLQYLTSRDSRIHETDVPAPEMEKMASWVYAVMIESLQPSFDVARDVIKEDLYSELHRELYYLNLNPHQSILFFSQDYADYELIARQIYFTLKRRHPARLYLSVSRIDDGNARLSDILRRLERLMEEQYYHPETHVFMDQESEETQVTEEAQDSRLIQLISEDISKKDLPKLRKHCRILTEKYQKQSQYSAMYIKFVFSSVLQELFQEPRFARQRRLDQQIDRLYASTNMEQILEITRQEVTEYGLFLERALSVSRREVAAVCNYIRENYPQDIRTEQLAELVHLPEGYLNYLFRNETGMSVHRFVMDVRMQQAGEALRTTDRRYEQIGLQSGFRNPEYFLRAFKGYFGMHPDEYRAEKRRLPANENI